MPARRVAAREAARVAALLLALLVAGPLRATETAAPSGGDTESNTDLAKKTQNPVADLISVPFQNNFNFNTVDPAEGSRARGELGRRGYTGWCARGRRRTGPQPDHVPADGAAGAAADGPGDVRGSVRSGNLRVSVRGARRRARAGKRFAAGVSSECFHQPAGRRTPCCGASGRRDRTDQRSHRVPQ